MLIQCEAMQQSKNNTKKYTETFWNINHCTSMKMPAEKSFQTINEKATSCKLNESNRFLTWKYLTVNGYRITKTL